MNEDFIEYETAKLAKEAGFNWPVSHAYWFKDRIDQYYGYCNSEATYKSVCSQAKLAKWIRERFDLLIRMYFDEEKLKFEPCYSLINVKTGFCTGISAEEMEFDSFEEANEESLKRTLRFIIEKKIHLKDK